MILCPNVYVNFTTVTTMRSLMTLYSTGCSSGSFWIYSKYGAFILLFSFIFEKAVLQKQYKNWFDSYNENNKGIINRMTKSVYSYSGSLLLSQCVALGCIINFEFLRRRESGGFTCFFVTHTIDAEYIAEFIVNLYFILYSWLAFLNAHYQYQSILKHSPQLIKNYLALNK